MIFAETSVGCVLNSHAHKILDRTMLRANKGVAGLASEACPFLHNFNPLYNKGLQIKEDPLGIEMFLDLGTQSYLGIVASCGLGQ